MAIKVDDIAVPLERGVDRPADGVVIWLPALLDAVADLVRRQGAVIDRDAFVGVAPYKPLAEPDLGQDPFIHFHFMGPLSLQHGGIDLRDISIWVEVAARKQGLDPCDTELRRKFIKLF